MVVLVAPSWWRLRLSLALQEAAAEERAALVPDLGTGFLSKDNWCRCAESLRSCLLAKGLTESEAEERAQAALCRALPSVASEFLASVSGAEEMLHRGGAAVAAWKAVAKSSASDHFGLSPLPMQMTRSLLCWLEHPQVHKVLPADEDFDVKGLTYLLNFIEDVEETGECSKEDVLKPEKGSRQLLHAAARVRRMVTSYARGLVLDVFAKPPDLVASALRSPSVALYAAKVIRQMGGDTDLCRIGAFALKPEGAHLGWFPLDGKRLPNLSNDLPDPFVHFAPQTANEKPLKWYLEICGAVGVVASSTRATKDEFDKAVQGACQAKIGSWARGKAAWPHRDAMLGDPRALLLACIVSRVLLNRQVAVAEGLEVLRDWVSENLETEKAARHRNRLMLANRMFSGLLPHLQEVTEEANSTDAPPRKLRQFLEQLAHHLALLVLGAGTQQAGWLEHEAAVVGAMGYVGWPMQLGICPAPGCGAPIGGEHHQNVHGVRTINEDRLLRRGSEIAFARRAEFFLRRHRSQPGYIAATSELDDTIVNQFKRQLNMRGLKALRLVLRVALWASLSSEQPRPAVDAVLPGAAASTKCLGMECDSVMV
eukprot:s1411_g9.t1